jgi:hypothetical protein
MENNEMKVSVTLGFTLNLGNFQSLRLDLGITENQLEGETKDEAFERVYNFVQEKLKSKIKEGREAILED